MAESSRLAATCQHDANHGAAPQQDQHTAERGRENLLRLRAERDTNNSAYAAAC